MSLLLDTHALLWWLAGDSIDAGVAERIADPTVLVVVSAASIWEAAIKQALGKLTTPGPLGPAALTARFEPLPIGFEHAQAAAELPHHHRDPFDRMLIAQALIEGLTIVTRDPAFSHYEVPIVSC